MASRDSDGSNTYGVSKVEESQAPDAVQYEAAPAPAPRTKKAILIAHLKRFWWAYLIIALALTALGVLLTIFVGVKSIAQSKINGAVLEVQGINCLQTETDQFQLSINTTMKSGTTKATVLPFDGVMYLEDEPSHTPFVTIRFPETHNMPFQTVNISQTVNVTDVAALTQFNTWLLSNESLRVTVEGHPQVKVPGISHKYTVHFKKTITMPGLNHFEGIRVFDSSISISNFSDGTNFHATTVIPNLSIVTFQIGNATFDTYLDGELLGTSYLNDVTLYPGNNTYPFRAEIAQVPVITGVTTQPYCESGILPFVLSGKTVVRNGQPLPYFADALAAQNTTVDTDIDTPLRALGLDPKCPNTTTTST